MYQNKKKRFPRKVKQKIHHHIRTISYTWETLDKMEFQKRNIKKSEELAIRGRKGSSFERKKSTEYSMSSTAPVLHKITLPEVHLYVDI